MLTRNNLEEWVLKYGLLNPSAERVIAIVMAGNIPLAGFHDLLSVLISGHVAMVKMSSTDKVLLPFIADLLISDLPDFRKRIFFVDKLRDFDAVIATGSGNTARYFEYYFAAKPRIIRKNRNSVAILTGHESDASMEKLGTDIFTYFGAGCRNVSKIFIPENYDWKLFYEPLEKFSDVMTHNRYANNYQYQKVMMFMNKSEFLDNGFLLLKKDVSFCAPRSVLHFEYYANPEDVCGKLLNDVENIQCVLAEAGQSYCKGLDFIAFGKSQLPGINDFPDNMDTMMFILTVSTQ
jgi:hypothetical protein